ncbi:MAG: acetyl ornithine aminotransferase family protein [Cyanobacteria bacterium P01_H01_bin.74]
MGNQHHCHQDHISESLNPGYHDKMHLPYIVSETLPGPKVAALIDRDKQYLSPSYTRGYPLAIDYGYGAMVVDGDRNRFLDFCAGIAVCSTGHSHPEVVSAIHQQAAKFLHMSGTDFYYSPMADLAMALAHSMPGHAENKVFFANSGAEANEAALKLARHATGRQYFVSFFRSFHGRTYGAMSVSASKTIQKKSFSPLLPGVLHAHYPYPYRDIFKTSSPEDCATACLDYIENTLFKHVISPHEVAAFIVEPVQGEGGYIIPPDCFLPRLQKLAHHYGILIISDEVQAGMGRTGKIWASSHFAGYEPDILTSAKGLASGLPLGACIAKSSVMHWEPGMHATTFGGNPVACAASLKTLELLQAGLLDNAHHQGVYLKNKLTGLMHEFDCVGDVRGLGLMIGVELVKSKACKTKNSALRDWLVDRAFYKGLLILGCGENSIRISPPLVINKEQSDCAVAIIRELIQEYLSCH